MTVLTMSDGELSRFDTLMRVERGDLHRPLGLLDDLKTETVADARAM